MVVSFSFLNEVHSTANSHETNNNIAVSKSMLKIISDNSPPFLSLGKSVSNETIPSGQGMYITIYLKINTASAEDYAAQISNPGSAHYRDFLSPSQFFSKFGPTINEISTVEAWLTDNGIANYSLNYGDQIGFVSSAGQITNLLHVNFSNYAYGGQQFYSIESNPAIPLQIANDVTYFGGLNNYNGIQTYTQNIGGYLSATPSDIYSYYGFTQAFNNGISGVRASIGVVGYPGEGINTNDVNSFWNDYGISPSSSVSEISVLGGPPNIDTGDGSGSMEMTLDSEWSGSTSPGATITVVTDNAFRIYDQTTETQYNNEIGYLVNTLVPNVITSSIGYNADSVSSGELGILNNYMVQAETEGVSVIAATGDSGFSSSGNIDALALNPYVTGVGGVDLGLSSSGIISETGWSGSAGGYYTGNSIYAQPGYQKGFSGVPSEGQSWRLAPDVSFPAGPSIAVYFNGGLVGGWGGTSFAAPMFAGVIADIDSVLYQGGATNGYAGMLGMFLYGISYSTGAYNDITTGNNGMSAGAGWDYVTGIGTINAYDFILQMEGQITY